MNTCGRQNRNDAARDRRLSRRAFIGAAGAAGSAAALAGVLGSGRPGAATAKPLARPRAGNAPLPATHGPVGATVQTLVYPRANNRYGAAEIFDEYVSRPGALTTQKWYFKEREWPSSVPSDMARLSAAGCKFIVCFKPTTHIDSMAGQADRASLLATCNMFLNHKSGGKPAPISFDAVLWQEPNNGKGSFANGKDYISYVKYYRPYVPAGIKVIYDCAGSASPNDQRSYFPRGLVDKVYCDFYGNSYKSKLKAGIQYPLYAIETIADDNGLPFGLGEWGFGISVKDALTPSSTPTAQQFADYIKTVFTNRLTVRKVNGAVLYYDGDDSSSKQNKITGAGDWKTPLYQEIYDALSPAG